MKAYSRIGVILPIGLLCAFLVFAPAQAALSWNTQQVKEYVWSGGDCPLAIDQNNNIHIAYLDGYTLIYACYNGHEWTNQTIANDGIYLIFSLALDAKGNPHLLYEKKLAGPLQIANWNGASWETQDIGVSYTDFAALALDSQANPHIVYTTTTTNINHDDWAKNTVNTSLKYALWTGTVWSTQTVDTVLVDGFSLISLALSKDDVPYILYSPSSDLNTIKLATVRDSNWKIQTAELPPQTGNCGNLVLDSKGFSHFLCSQINQDATETHTLLYATFNLSAWDTQTVDSKIDLGKIAKLTLDSQDNPHFTYSTSKEESIYVAFSGSAWQNETLPPNIKSGDLWLDSSGNPHMLYRVYSPARFCSGLMYATATGTIPAITSAISPETQDNILVLLVLAVFIFVGAAVATVLFWKRRSQHFVAY